MDKPAAKESSSLSCTAGAHRWASSTTGVDGSALIFGSPRRTLNVVDAGTECTKCPAFFYGLISSRRLFGSFTVNFFHWFFWS